MRSLIHEESGTALGEGLSILIDLLNPEMIIIGSIYQRSEDLLFASAKKEIERNALTRSVSACRIVPSALKDSLGDLAALSLVTG